MLPKNATTRFAGPQKLEDRARAEFYDGSSPPDELRVISQKPGTPLAANLGFWYSYDEHEETFIYDIGAGINQTHENFSSPHRRIEWLYTPLTKSHHFDTPTEMPEAYGGGDHATCTSSEAAERFSGSARKATLVVVKHFDTAAGRAEIFETIAQEIVAKRRNHHCVVTVSFSLRNNDEFSQKISSDVMMLVRRGVPIIAAGNTGPGYVFLYLISSTSKFPEIV